MSIPEAKGKETINEDEIEIRLSDIVQFLKDSRRKIIVGAIVGFVLGALYAFNKPNMYSAQVTVMPEIQGKGSGNLSGLGSLAGLAGINLDNINAQDAIRPDLYPNVLQSIPFALTILKQPVYSQKAKAQVSLQKFIEDKESGSSLNVIDRLIGLFTDDSKSNNKEDGNLTKFSQAIQITKEQDALIKAVQSSASATHDKKTGILTIAATESDPVVAATVARLSLDYLTNYVVTYRTEKARKQVSFLIRQVDESKKRYQASELAFSAYRDRNRGTYLNTAKIDEQRLQADYLLAQSVYNDLSKQLEQAKIKVQEETPVFKVLEPPTIPIRKSGPKRTLIMLGFMAAGAIVTLIIALIKRISFEEILR